VYSALAGNYMPLWIAALAGCALALVQRNRLLLGLVAGAIIWVLVEIAFALHGWPALARYLMEPAGIACVLAGIMVAWLLLDGPRLRPRIPYWAGIAVVAILVAALVPGALTRLRTERVDLRHERGRTREIGLLQTTTTRLGGYRHILNCGQPVTDVEYVSAMAWLYHVNVGFVGGLQQHVQAAELRARIPKVLFTPLPHGGWKVVPWHTLPSKQARCHGLNAAYVVTRSHPGGVLIHH